MKKTGSRIVLQARCVVDVRWPTVIVPLVHRLIPFPGATHIVIAGSHHHHWSDIHFRSLGACCHGTESLRNFLVGQMPEFIVDGHKESGEVGNSGGRG
jgi:hypothetical protein